MENKDYERYKEPLKKSCIYSVISSAFGLLTVLFMFFLPVFTGGIKMDETLQKISYSPFQDMIELIKGFELGAFSILMLFPYIILIAGSVMVVRDMVKNILCIARLDEYLLETYDGLKNGQNEKIVVRGYYGESRGVGLIVSGLIIFVMYKLIFQYWISTGYSFGGVSGWVVLPIICLITVWVFSSLSSSHKRKIRRGILKEKYAMKEGNPTITETSMEETSQQSTEEK